MSRYDLFRKRIAPVAFMLAVALLAKQSCDHSSHAHATIVLGYGDAEPRVRAVDADLFVADDAVAHYHRAALDGMHIGPCKFEVLVPGEDGELRVEVDLGGKKQLVRRAIHAVDGAVVSVDLSRDLL